MKPFKRTVEKVLAWIGNIILFLLTGVMAYSIFGRADQLEALKNNPELTAQLKTILANEPGAANVTTDQLLTLMIASLKIYTIVLIVFSVVALIATLILKKRIVSGIIFLLLSIFIAIGSVGVLLPVYLPYFIVAIMLFVRKEPETVNVDSSQTYL